MHQICMRTAATSTHQNDLPHISVSGSIVPKVHTVRPNMHTNLVHFVLISMHWNYLRYSNLVAGVSDEEFTSPANLCNDLQVYGCL